MFLIIMWREARERPDRSLCYKSLTLSCPIIHTTLRETLCKHTHTPETHILSPTTTSASVPSILPGSVATLGDHSGVFLRQNVSAPAINNLALRISCNHNFLAPLLVTTNK